MKSVNTPIYQSSTFELDDESYAGWAAGDPDVLVYTRMANPTLNAAAEKMAALEGAEKGLVFASGLAAIHAAIVAHLDAGDCFVTTPDIYGGTFGMFNAELKRLGLVPIFVDMQDLDAVRDAFADAPRPPKVLFAETVTNPMLKVYDLPKLAALAHEHGAVAIADNTFATPIHCRPLTHGFDLVVHSATKYLNGHSDLVGGTVVGPADRVARVWECLKNYGGCMDPHAAALLERGAKTLSVRVERATANAMEIALWLTKQPKVRKVIYPGLPDHPDHALAQRLLDGPGAMLVFVVEGGDAAGRRLMDALTIPTQAVSLGGVESLISMPANSTHLSWNDEAKAAIGLDPGSMRLSVGIEAVEDLIADLAMALEQL